eukprot:GHVH01010642.1.p1 GENE.GHVH01010642.1~~GHVH01010642.1.p1  ORF type:complete len:432 (-),score=51.65 GHVH01010642.1:109-1404(-)
MNMIKRSQHIGATSGLLMATTDGQNRTSVTSRGMMMRNETPVKPAAARQHRGLKPFICSFRGFFGVMKRFLPLAGVIIILIIFGFIFFEEFLLVDSAEDMLHLSQSNEADTANSIHLAKSLDGLSGSVATDQIKDYVAEFNRNYVRSEVIRDQSIKKAQSQIEQVQRELMNLKNEYEEAIMKKNQASQTDHEILALKDKLAKLEQAQTNAQGRSTTNTTEFDWAHAHLGVEVKMINGKYNKYAGRPLLMSWIGPLSSVDAITDDRLKQGPTNSLLQSPKSEFVPGDCYPMDYKGAVLELSLQMQMKISAITLHHLPKVQRINGRFSAPQLITISAYNSKQYLKTSDDAGLISKALDFAMYNLEDEDPLYKMETRLKWDKDDGHEIIPFAVSEPVDRLRIALDKPMDDVDFICLYRISVHGAPMKPAAPFGG